MTVFTNVLTLILTAEIPWTHKEERKPNSRGVCWGKRDRGSQRTIYSNCGNEFWNGGTSALANGELLSSA